MTTVKIAISLPHETLERARRAVKSGVAASVSAYIAEAINEKVSPTDFDEMLDEMLEKTGGPMTEAEYEDACRDLGFPILSPAERAKRLTSVQTKAPQQTKRTKRTKR